MWASARIRSVTSKASSKGLASTLTLTSMRGCWPGIRLAGACGFSNERSLTYWARTPIAGAAPGAGRPFAGGALCVSEG